MEMKQNNGIGLLNGILFGAILTGLVGFSPSSNAAGTAQYSNLNYDVVYVRCPRGKEPVNWKGNSLLNWNGVNDMWLSAANNIYHQPGCDLVLHHSDPGYAGGLAAGDRGREEVLVNCDEDNLNVAVCTVVDPNVSFDGRFVVYSKFEDTRNFVSSTGMLMGGAGSGFEHSQSYVELTTSGGQRYSSTLRPFSAPAMVYIYDLLSKTEKRVSPDAKMFSGRALPGKSTEWIGNIPVMDTGPFFMPDGRIGFTSNRESGFSRFQMLVMDVDGRNMEIRGHRAMNQQLHPAVLKDGRVAYTSNDVMLQKGTNNNYSLFTINGDGSFPFILAGKHDATSLTYHFTTQLSDGDIVTTLYYNHNNGGMGTLLRFPIDPPGADFAHVSYTPGEWRMGNSTQRFIRKGQVDLTPEATAGDSPQVAYDSSADYWTHPSRSSAGRTITIGGSSYAADKSQITMKGRFLHPSGAPENDMLVTYTIGASSTMGGYSGGLSSALVTAGKDAGVWLIPLEPNSTRTVGHIATDGRIVVDFPEYHEIMPRAVVSYAQIYGVSKPGLDSSGNSTQFVKGAANLGNQDSRLAAGGPFALSGASSLYDRETRAYNGVPWNMLDGGGYMSGRTYTNLASSGADLAIYDSSEIWGIRVILPIPNHPNDYYGNTEVWTGAQQHHVRILGEFPVRKTGGNPVDAQGNPDTSFVVKIPADTPFMFQTIDKRGMALDMENSSRTEIRGGQQFCIGCHVHTREGMDPFISQAKVDTSAAFGDFSGASAPLFSGVDGGGNPVVNTAQQIYNSTTLPNVNNRRSFAIDWENGISTIIQNRCASCHAEGQSAQQLTGLRLDGKPQTYDLLLRNKYTREDGANISSSTKSGDGLNDVINNTAGTDRITKRYSCCTDSRWISYNSARSSMLVWALYGERLDGRNPATGQPWGATGESVPADKAGLSGVLVDKIGREYPEVWPKVGEHLAHVAGMPDSEKRLITRWIDIGAPKLNVHDDMIRPVLTVTPVLQGSNISSVYVGLWDDSPIDYSRFSITVNGTNITPTVNGAPDTISVPLSTAVTDQNADSLEFVFEVWDKPNRALSYKSPGVAAANRTRLTLTGRGLLRMVNRSPNSAPTSASASITAYLNTPSAGVIPIVMDPDIGDVHAFSIQSQPSSGSAAVVNNKLVYTPNGGFSGSDSFSFTATDLGGLSVTGTASVTVSASAPPANTAPTSTSASILTNQDQVSAGVIPSVVDADSGNVFTFNIESQASNGTASVVNGRLVYAPNSGFFGSDSFTFRATDQGGLSVVGTASVTVNEVVINPPGNNNSAPTSTSASITTIQDSASNPTTPVVTDPDSGDSHTFSIVTQPVSGAANVVNNRLVYTPIQGFNGLDQFTFRATDNGGLFVDGTANVTVLVANTNPGGGSSSSLVISNTTPTNYAWFSLKNLGLIYGDRTMTYTNVPSQVDGLEALRTDNNDKLSSGSNNSFISFSVNEDVRVYIAHDDNISSKPGWLQDYVDSGLDLDISGFSHSLFEKTYTAGTINLGGNGAASTSTSMYVAIVEGLGTTTVPNPGTGGSTNPNTGGDTNSPEAESAGAVHPLAILAIWLLALVRRRERR